MSVLHAPNAASRENEQLYDSGLDTAARLPAWTKVKLGGFDVFAGESILLKSLRRCSCSSGAVRRKWSSRSTRR